MSARTFGAMQMPLRLAVDARVVAEDTRGVGRYERAILRRLVQRNDVAITLLVNGPFAFRHRGRLGRTLGSDNFRVSSHVESAIDVVWHPANGTFFSSSHPSVATIHDAVPFRYPNGDDAARRHVQEPFLRSARSAARVIAVSRFGADELHDALAIERERIDVIYHGVEPSFTPGPADALPAGLAHGSYLLFVGDPIAEPRKNFAMLYDAFQRAWPNGDGPHLVVAGPRAPELPRVVAAGEVGDDLRDANNTRMRSLYRGAAALALASYHETFGMPLIEAMACGTPVIASRASCLPEIGADAALYAPPDDAGAWSDGLRRITGDAELRTQLRDAGIARAKHFDWDASARAHLQLFRSLSA